MHQKSFKNTQLLKVKTYLTHMNLSTGIIEFVWCLATSAPFRHFSIGTKKTFQDFLETLFPEILNFSTEDPFVLKGPQLTGYTIVGKLQDI